MSLLPVAEQMVAAAVGGAEIYVPVANCMVVGPWNGREDAALRSAVCRTCVGERSILILTTFGILLVSEMLFAFSFRLPRMATQGT